MSKKHDTSNCKWIYSQFHLRAYKQYSGSNVESETRVEQSHSCIVCALNRCAWPRALKLSVSSWKNLTKTKKYRCKVDITNTKNPNAEASAEQSQWEIQYSNLVPIAGWEQRRETRRRPLLHCAPGHRGALWQAPEPPFTRKNCTRFPTCGNAEKHPRMCFTHRTIRGTTLYKNPPNFFCLIWVHWQQHLSPVNHN